MQKDDSRARGWVDRSTHPPAMLLSPAVRFPYHHVANKTPSAEDEHNFALYNHQVQRQLVDASDRRVPHWLPPLTQPQQQQQHPYSCRAIMSEEPWYQSISDYEDETYFNSPFLQHPMHASVPQSSDLQNASACDSGGATNGRDVKILPTVHGLYPPYADAVDDKITEQHPMWLASRNPFSSGAAAYPNNFSAWHSGSDTSSIQGHTNAIMPGQSPMEIYTHSSLGASSSSHVPSNAFGSLDMEGPVTAPVNFSGMSGLDEDTFQPYHAEKWLSDNSQPAKPLTQGIHSHSPASPMTSLASQSDLSSSAVSPYLSVYDRTADSPYGQCQLASLSPSHANNESEAFSAEKPRKSLPNGPLRAKSAPSHISPIPQLRQSSTDLEQRFSRSRSPASSRSSSSSSSNSSSSSSSSRSSSNSGGLRATAFKRAHAGAKKSDTGRFLSQMEARATKDQFLITARNKGMSYRDIKASGRFPEAESTLRGRYRMLTKSREERVRSPQWTDVDLALLQKAVRSLCQGRNADSIKISWKDVAQYIVDHGGSYHFGNATCRKKWDELTAA